MLRKQAWICAKVVMACAAVTALVTVPAQRLAPGLSLLELLALLFGGFVSLVVLAISSLALAQFVLRAGGRDPQWFWFGGEPLGLQGVREDARSKGRES